MTTPADNFFKDIDYTSIIDTVKGIFTSDGSMSVLLDFERVLDESDLYAFKNWILGELVQGPVSKRYTVSCVFMYPHKLMPDPRGAKRLAKLGCKIKFMKTKIEVPIEVKKPEDFLPGTRYPKSIKRDVWLIYIEMPKDLMNDIREGSVDLAGQNIDLGELDNAYEEDLDQKDTDESGETSMTPAPGPGAPTEPMPGTAPPAPTA